MFHLKKERVKELMKIKTHDIVEHGKNAEDPLVIPKEDEPSSGSTKRTKSWNEIEKGMSQ